MFSNLLDPIFNPLLKLGYFWAIFILSFVLTLLITIVYKFATNQELMKKLKKEMKDLQKELKSLTKSNPSKAMTHQKKVMEKNMQYMKHSMKPTLYTFIPIIIIFGWLNAHLAFMPIEPNEPFTVSVYLKEGSFGDITISSLPELNILSNPTQEIQSNIITWELSGDEGNYLLEFSYDNRDYEKELLITSEKTYATPEKVVKDSNIQKIVINNEKVRPFQELGLSVKTNWIWTYILLSLIFSFSLRKLLKIS